MDNLKEKIMEKMPFEARIIYNILNNKGFKTYVVGGALRDIVLAEMNQLKVDINDWDFATVATAEDIKNLFNKSLRVKNDNDRIISLSSSTELLIPTLGTTSVKIGRKRFEVTPIEDNDIIKDLMDRDFTINSLAFNDNELIYKYVLCGRTVNIMEHLEEGVLEFNINPFDYTEVNPVSIIRALRFANKYNLKIDEDTLDVFRFNGKLLRDINKGKLYMNFEKFMLIDEFKKSEYILKSNILSSVCETWEEGNSLELIECMNKSVNLGKDIKDRLKFIYNKFTLKEQLIDLYYSFGVKKDFIDTLK